MQINTRPQNNLKLQNKTELEKNSTGFRLELTSGDKRLGTT
jgi:hypothetical protein